MIVPVLRATLHSLSRERLHRLGGIERVTLRDLARECREGNGDAGICFEYAVHEALAHQDSLLFPLASEVLERFCTIPGGAESILFGPEKEGVIPILESVQDALTEDSVVYVGNRGRPPRLRRYVPQIIRAYRRNEERTKLPRSIVGLWKADLFIGNHGADRWVGSTVKVNPATLEGAKGLRLGIYPKQNTRDVPRLDGALNLVRLPLPYDSNFMEMFYKSFFLVGAFLRADGCVPTPVNLPDAQDRFITRELEQRREFPCIGVIEVLQSMAQADLLKVENISSLKVDATLSVDGLRAATSDVPVAESVSISPLTSTRDNV